MRAFLWILGIVFLLALGYALVTGLGLGGIFKHHKNLTKSMVITDFEYPNDDFDWMTGGYVKIEPAKENQTHGKLCAKATFLLQSQFFPTPTPGVEWRPQMSLDTNSVTQLKVYEWQEYADLKLDVFNPQDHPVIYHMEVADSHGFVFSDITGPLTPKKVTNIDVPLDKMIQARLDLSNIRSIKFWVDLTGATEPVVVYLDYLRLEGDATAPKAAPAVKH